jgi:hypothetical protein
VIEVYSKGDQQIGEFHGHSSFVVGRRIYSELERLFATYSKHMYREEWKSTTLPLPFFQEHGVTITYQIEKVNNNKTIYCKIIDYLTSLL